MLTAGFSVLQVLSPDYGQNASWGDMDADGFVDVVLTGYGLFKNNGGTSFTSLPEGFGPGVWGDYNADGNLDYFAMASKLAWPGNGDGTFGAYVTIPGVPGSPTETATWFDMENDGDLDLYIANYGDTLGAKYDTIYRNDGNDGVGESCGNQCHNFVHYWTQPGGSTNSRGATLIDYNEDNNMDIYVTRYRLEPNGLWENNGSGGFTDVAAAKNALGGNGHGIGSAVGDFDNDGHMDIFAQNFAHSFNPYSQMLRNTGPSGNYAFEVKQTFSPPNWVEDSATAAVGDVDNDGDLDLFISNTYGSGARLYENPGVTSSAEWNFSNVTGASGLPGMGINLQAAFADIDNDGDLDLIADNTIFENNTSQTTSNNWLRVKLAGDGVLVNTTAIGAVVRADLGGGKILTRMVEGATGRGNQNEQTLHFGLGTYSGSVPLEITWPDGTIETVSADPNQRVEFTIGGGGGPSVPVYDVGEVGQITNLTHSQQVVTLSRAYSRPVVFVQSVSNNDAQPAVVRVSNVQSNQFRIALEEASNLDGIHAAETVTYVVLEAGSHELPDGTLMEVGTVDTSATVGNRTGNSWEFVNLQSSFSSSPVVLSQIQTTNGPEDYLQTRYLSTSASMVILAMEPAESVTTSVDEETVGYLAIESGSGRWNGMRYEAGLTGDDVTSATYDLSYSSTFQSAPSLVTSLASYDNGDNAHLRYSNPTKNGVQLRVEEDTTYDSETSHGSEEVAYLAIGGEEMLTAKAQQFNIGEVGQIANLTHSVQTITLSNTYIRPVVFAQSASNNDSQPAVVRVTNVQSNSFKISMKEASNLDGIHASETVTYVVLEAGTHLLEDGTWVEAGTVDTARTVGNRLGNSWESVSFDASFSTTPVVLSQVQTTNGASLVKTRYLTTSASSILLALEQEEGITTPGVEETVGYLAMEPGSGTWDGMRYEAGLTADAVTNSLYQHSFSTSFSSAPNLLASLASYDNSDNAHVRYADLLTGGVRLKVEEDTTYDSETSHGSEEVAYLAIQGTGSLTSPTAPANSDFNSDSVVDLADLMIWQRGFGLAGQTGNSQGDANGSGVVDSADLDIWKTQFTGSSGSAASSMAPAAEVAAAESPQASAAGFFATVAQGAVSGLLPSPQLAASPVFGTSGTDRRSVDELEDGLLAVLNAADRPAAELDSADLLSDDADTGADVPVSQQGHIDQAFADEQWTMGQVLVSGSLLG